MKRARFEIDDLILDCEKEVDRIVASIRRYVKEFKKRGLVVAISGGIDSSLVAALSARALGQDRTLALLMPDKESAPETLGLSQLLSQHFGLKADHIDITRILCALGCYEKRDRAISEVISDYNPNYKCKIVLPSLLDDETYRVFSVVVQSPDGEQKKARLPSKAYLEILAAMNFKQRVRKMIEYHHADRLNYAVAGTPNLQEYDQGFFVKLGDGAADMKPIAHLYKTQVYQLAEFLGVPKEILACPPTTDTYSMPQSQDEFYFSVPYEVMDYCLYGEKHNLPPEEVAQAIGLRTEQVERVYREITNKRTATRYQHAVPVLVENG